MSSEAVIQQLRKQGILALVIDLSKQPDQQPDCGQSAQPPAASVSKLPTKGASFTAEIERAKGLYEQGKLLQKRLLNGVKRGLPVDLAVPKEFSEKLVESIDPHPDALLCLTRIRQKDSYLLEHSLNVAILLAHFDKQLGFSSRQVSELALAGFLHDIGKIKIPDAILHKLGKLTDEEMQTMRSHVSEGVVALRQTGLLSIPTMPSPPSAVTSPGCRPRWRIRYCCRNLRTNMIKPWCRSLSVAWASTRWAVW